MYGEWAAFPYSQFTELVGFLGGQCIIIGVIYTFVMTEFDQIVHVAG